jgi:hypothetical protein
MDGSTSRCGQFDEAYIQALKGVRFCLPSPTSTNYHRMDRFIYTSFISRRDLPAQVAKTYPIFSPASHPGRSYYGPPTYRCPHCKAIFWLREGLRQGSARRNGQPIYNNCCRAGRVVIPPFAPRPEPLNSLARFDGDAGCNRFMKNIRQYNCLFAFTSMGAKIDRSMDDGRGPPVFKISGQVHHRIGSLLPQEGLPPKFIRLYIYDTANEISNTDYLR